MQWTKWFLELIPFILYIPVYVQSNTPETGHFRVASSLSSKARLRAKPMRCKCGAWKKELKPLWQYFHMVVFFSISQHKIWIFSWILTLTTFVKERVTVRFSSVKKFGPYKTNPTLSDNDQHVRPVYLCVLTADLRTWIIPNQDPSELFRTA